MPVHARLACCRFCGVGLPGLCCIPWLTTLYTTLDNLDRSHSLPPIYPTIAAATLPSLSTSQSSNLPAARLPVVQYTALLCRVDAQRGSA
eukprot:50254-Chlamydomonas_euryale.AAC.1